MRHAPSFAPVANFNSPEALPRSGRVTQMDMGGAGKERLKEETDLDHARKVKRNAEIDHDVSILRQKAAKKRKEAAATMEKVKKLELEAVNLENKASELERTKVQ
jgi:hypothetical protein